MRHPAGIKYVWKKGNWALGPVLFLLTLLWTATVLAATHTVTTCNSTSINSAISAASAGDDVYLDCATGTVSSKVTLNKSVTLHGRSSNYKNGTAATTLTMSSTIEMSGSGNMAIVLKDVKLTGTVNMGFLIISGSLNGWRVSNVWIETGHYAIASWGYQRGVIDNRRFTTLGGYNAVVVHIEEGNVAAAYARPSSLGTVNAFFLEDNIIVGSPGGIEFIMSQAGQGYVFRHNSITDYTLDIHGHCSSTGTRDYEIYENDWYATGDFSEGFAVIRGGTGVIYNNRLHTNGHTIWEVSLWLQEIFYAAMCASETGGSCHCTTYPCTYQIGRGQNNTLDPAYFWNNTRDGSQTVGSLNPNTACCGGGGSCANNCGGHNTTYFVQDGRDFYGNTAKPGYVAYTYPHPLRNAANSQTLPASPGPLNVTP